ncbi:hypothetical protein [Vibrio sp. ER1A]|uniref:hypothetical protein n=1 Tax=Vibrio sp. ER1A TaxID=1517681 RepID=UPI0004DCE2F7|nr:hypothetical protein [Vibrio sp. ER1A]KFA99237.1 hypothetical protein HW45_05045 [Vibrio sp. ER1A]
MKTDTKTSKQLMEEYTENKVIVERANVKTADLLDSLEYEAIKTVNGKNFIIKAKNKNGLRLDLEVPDFMVAEVCVTDILRKFAFI